MHLDVGILSPMLITARHLANRAPNCRYSASRSRSPSRPSVTFSPGKFAIALAPLSTLIPGMIPCSSSASTKVRPSRVFCRIVSSKRITPLINSPDPAVVNKISRYARRLSSVEGTLMLFNRFSIVPELSSAARIPLPEATNFLAMDSKFSIFIAFLLQMIFAWNIGHNSRPSQLTKDPVAMSDLEYRSRGAQHQRRDRRALPGSCVDARKWIASNDRLWPYSFLNLCDAANLDWARFVRN